METRNGIMRTMAVLGMWRGWALNTNTTDCVNVIKRWTYDCLGSALFDSAYTCFG